MEEKKMTREERTAQKEGIVEIRLYSSLVGEIVDSEEYSKSLDANDLRGYEHTIRKALQSDWIRERETGLAEFLEIDSLKDKMISMYPAVEVWDYRLWGVLEVKSREELTPEEIAIIKREWRGQMTDGWGEGFVQDEMDCGEGCSLYVDFGAASRRGVFTEQELKGNSQEQGRRQTEGMGGIS